MQNIEKISTFSSTNEIKIWLSNNCHKCEKAYHLTGNEPEMTKVFIKKLIEDGKECRLKAYVDRHVKVGHMPRSVALEIGLDEFQQKLVSKCCKRVLSEADKTTASDLSLFDTSVFKTRSKNNTTYDL